MTTLFDDVCSSLSKEEPQAHKIDPEQIYDDSSIHAKKKKHTLIEKQQRVKI